MDDRLQGSRARSPTQAVVLATGGVCLLDSTTRAVAIMTFDEFWTMTAKACPQYAEDWQVKFIANLAWNLGNGAANGLAPTPKMPEPFRQPLGTGASVSQGFVTNTQPGDPPYPPDTMTFGGSAEKPSVSPEISIREVG